MNGLLQAYISEIKKIYGTHLSKIILYGSYARGDFRPDSDVALRVHLPRPGESVKGRGLGMAAKFPAQVQSVRESCRTK